MTMISEAHMTGGPMRLMVDVESVAKKGVVHLCIGGLTFPITREDLVTLLFGESVAHFEPSKRSARQPAKRPPKREQRHHSGGKQIAAAAAKRRKERAAKGLCYADCNRKAAPGKSYCLTHLRRLRAGILKGHANRKANEKASQKTGLRVVRSD